MVGQAQVLKLRDGIEHWKTKTIDVSGILYPANTGNQSYNTETQDHGLEEAIDWQLLKHAEKAIESREPVFANFELKNTNRTVGTILSYEVTRKYHAAGLPANTINYKFKGSAGQSFAAFCTKGLSFELEGEANDYVGKGLSGAQVAIYPAKEATFVPEENIIIGNVALYGATAGELFVRGQAGERFAVRNSGATAVVEGVGDHGCEYMTGGRVLILGQTGRNFAAGMSGGIAWIYDPGQSFQLNCNAEMVDLDPLDKGDEQEILSLLNKHFNLTQSQVAKYILDDWAQQSAHFIKVFPKDFKRVYTQTQVTR